MTYKVVYVNPLPDYIDRFLETVPANYHVTIVPPDAEPTEQCRAAAEADVLLSGVDVDETVFRAAKNAKFIQYMSSGYGQLPLSKLDELGVPVAQMKTHSISVAEHAITLMLTLLRRIPHSMRLLREGLWRENLEEESYAELYGKTVGIVGLGNIGRWVAKIAHYGFGANVVYYDRAEIPLTVSEMVSASAVSLPELMSVSDIVCVCLPLNKESDKLIGRNELALMDQRSILVNISRGEVIDQEALIDALRGERIGGAGLDVYESEPLDLGSELLKLHNVVCTPHMAGVGWENVNRRIETVWENFDIALRGGIPRGVITAVNRISSSALSPKRLMNE